MAAKINFVVKGGEFIKDALEKDKAGQFDEALALYSQGIQYLMTALKYEKPEV